MYAAVLDPGSPATPDLARLAFGAVLWALLTVMNHGAFNGVHEAVGDRTRLAEGEFSRCPHHESSRLRLIGGPRVITRPVLRP